MNTSIKTACPVCASPHLELFFDMLEVPVYCNVLWSAQKAARDCLRGDIRLAFCPKCGFVTNVAFDPARLNYSQDYENSLHYSTRFQEYALSLAKQLIERHNLFGKNIIEIGCGKGDFLISLCELGNNQGIGFDPTYVVREEHHPMEGQVKFIQDYYSERYTAYQGDLICCRHTLEHIQYPTMLLNTVRQTIGERLHTIVFFEVPNSLHTFRNLAVWDIIYEHCSYFTPVSLAYTFSSCGFQVCELTEEFEGQFLGLEALPSSKVVEMIENRFQDEVKQLTSDISAFTTNFNNKVETWKRELKRIQDKGQRAVLWGAGSKGVTFLNVLNLQNEIQYIVDINPRKQGMYVPGTGQQIVSPEFLQGYQPEVVIVMNSIYKNEIQQLTNNLGLNPEFLCV